MYKPHERATKGRGRADVIENYFCSDGQYPSLVEIQLLILDPPLALQYNACLLKRHTSMEH